MSTKPQNIQYYMKHIYTFLLTVLFPLCGFAQSQNYYLYPSEQARSLSNIAFSYYEKGDYIKAIEYEEKALSFANDMNADLQCAISYMNLCTYNRSLGYNSKALDYVRKTLSLLEKDANERLYFNALSELSACLLGVGEYENALSIMKEAMSMFQEHNDDYYRYQLNLANCYYSMGEYNESIDILESILKYEENKSSIEDTFRASLLENLALNYQHTGRLRDALWSEERALSIKTKIYGDNSIKCAESMYLLGHLYLIVGNHDKATKLGEKAAKIIEKEIGTQNIDYVNALRTLSLSYTDSSKVIEVHNHILDILKECNLGGPITYINSCDNLAEVYAKMGEKEKMLEVMGLLANNYNVQTLFKNNSHEFAMHLNRFASYHFYLGEYDKSIEYGKRALSIFKNLYGDQATYYSNCILQLFMSYIKDNDSIQSVNLLKETDLFDCLKSDLIKSIDLLSYQNRTNYWKTYSETFCNFIPLVAYATNDSYFISQAYNISALLAKGFLLNSETKLSELINKHGTLSIKQLYESYLFNKSQIPKVIDDYKRDSILTLLNNQEDKIWQLLKSQDLVERTDISWNDIQRSLKSEDIAIEFISFHDGDNKPYDIALILRKEYNSPKLIYLEKCSRIKEYTINNERDSIYLAIWSPIIKELDGIKNIYFSPSGQIFNTPIEYLSGPDGVFMNEKYNIYRLSSTQNLIMPRKTIKYEKSFLYGGLDYEYMPTTSTITNNTKSKHVPMDRGLELSLKNRSGFEPLPNTNTEVTEIGEILAKSNIDYTTFSGVYGIEESFKNLSGKRCDIIHIATHGMYIDINTDKTFLSVNNLEFIDNKKMFSFEEDAALARSFLVMSRGNGLPKRHSIPTGIDDGILTAQEIANIDLKGIDLVVLSACQSALGVINNEGIYGLQRGFKKAGVNSILMSLDKVDDEATRILMVEFYRNLMNGETKHQSLKNAQRYLRQVDNGKYDKPEYWASFIMLDGLN